MKKMIKKNILIDKIPAILWGETSPKIFIAVHGNMSSNDLPISMLAEETIPLGYRVLSFDLPGFYGDRKNDVTLCRFKTVLQIWTKFSILLKIKQIRLVCLPIVWGYTLVYLPI